MIKTLIAGCSSPVAGELFRILVHHPDVELLSPYFPELKGQSVTETYYGLTGDTDLRFTSVLNIEQADVAFICGEEPLAEAVRDYGRSHPDFRIIDLSEDFHPGSLMEGYVYGVPEIYRKPLVRGATKAVIPGCTELMTLVALYPLALNLLLSGNVDLTVCFPVHTPLKYRDPRHAAECVETVLRSFQNSWNGSVRFNVNESDSTTGMRVTARLRCGLDAGELMKVYDSVYDDHNFTFFSLRKNNLNEVTGTHKSLITLSPCGEELEVEIISDAVLRGGAGDAVHVMNLLFGLHEKQVSA